MVYILQRIILKKTDFEEISAGHKKHENYTGGKDHLRQIKFDTACEVSADQ